MIGVLSAKETHETSKEQGTQQQRPTRPTTLTWQAGHTGQITYPPPPPPYSSNCSKYTYWKPVFSHFEIQTMVQRKGDQAWVHDEKPVLSLPHCKPRQWGYTLGVPPDPASQPGWRFHSSGRCWTRLDGSPSIGRQCCGWFLRTKTKVKHTLCNECDE